MIVKNSSLSVDTEKLRKKILDLAMRGKLVPQDSQDEPASVLLEKIKEEKAQLIKEKKIKKSKPLPEITEEEKLFEIPESWEWVRLDEVTNIVMGQAPKGTLVKENEKGFEFHQGKTHFTDYIIGRSDKTVSLDNRVIGPKSIVMSVRAPVGDVNIVDREIYIGRGLSGIKSIISDYKYLFYFLLTQKEKLNTQATGSTFKAINGNIVKSIIIPLPPLAEQKRIVAKVEECMQAIKTIEDSSKEYEKLQNQLDKKVLDLAMRGKLVPQDSQDEPASVLLEKIKEEKAQLIKEKKIKKSKPLPEITEEEKPFEIPESWEWVRLGDVLQSIFAGGDKPKEFSEVKTDKYAIPVIANGRKSKGVVGYTNSAKVYGEALTISARGTIGYSVVRKDPFYPIVRLICIQDTILNLDFISVAIKDLVIEGTGSSIPQLTVPKLKTILIPLPPLAEQKRIVAKIEEIKQYLEI